MSLDRLGVTNDLATSWRDALEAAGRALRGSVPHPFVWALGAWQDLATQIVTVDFTIDGIFGELQMRPVSAWGPPGLPDADRVELDAGTLSISDATVNSTLVAAMQLPTGQVLRLGVLIPACRGCSSTDAFAPNRADLVELIDRTVTAGLG